MIADFHNDVLTSLEKDRLLLNYAESGNDVVCVYFKGNGTFADALSSCREFARVKARNQYLAFEDISYSEELTAIDALLDFSPVYASLTWNNQNALGGGATSVGDLTDLGKKIIGLLNSRGVALDLAHANEKTFYHALGLAEYPVCSHANCFELCPHPRNLKDEQISALVSRGGIMGMTFYPPFLKSGTAGEREAGVEDIVDHIEHFCLKFSSDAVCIGSDINGCEKYIQGFFDYSFEDTLDSALARRGFSAEEREKILYRNLRNFLNRYDK